MGKITISQLKAILGDFARWLQSWQKLGEDNLVRVEGPILQGLWLDRLRTGEYRPTFYVRILTVPRKKGGMDLMQFLSIKNRAIKPSLHEELFSKIQKEAELEIVPSISKSLNVDDVYNELERRAAPNPAQVAALASLALYRGQEKVFHQWKSTFFEILDTKFKSSKKRYLDAYESFFADASASINDSTSQKFMEHIIRQQKEEEGIA